MNRRLRLALALGYSLVVLSGVAWVHEASQRGRSPVSSVCDLSGTGAKPIRA